MIRFLDKLSPFGECNPLPIFLTRNVRVVNGARIVGNNHLKFRVADDRASFDAIAFNMGHYLNRVRERDTIIDILYNVEENEWHGRKNIQLIVKAIR